jgi:hypothetical protein
MRFATWSNEMMILRCGHAGEDVTSEGLFVQPGDGFLFNPVTIVMFSIHFILRLIGGSAVVVRVS